MRLLPLCSIFITLTLVSMLKAQTISSSNNSDGHPCGGYSSPSIFTAPKGTISYYDFVSNLGTYFDKDEYSKFGHYDVKANEFQPTPIVSFVLTNFFSVELGSMHMGARDSILFGIKADECEDIVIHRDNGENQFIASLSAHLRFRDEKFIKPEHADKYVKIFAKIFLEALARPGGKILVIARPVNYSWQAIGDRIRYLRLGFEIEDYHVVQ